VFFDKIITLYNITPVKTTWRVFRWGMFENFPYEIDLLVYVENHNNIVYPTKYIYIYHYLVLLQNFTFTRTTTIRSASLPVVINIYHINFIVVEWIIIGGVHCRSGGDISGNNNNNNNIIDDDEDAASDLSPRRRRPVIRVLQSNRQYNNNYYILLLLL